MLFAVLLPEEFDVRPTVGERGLEEALHVRVDLGDEVGHTLDGDVFARARRGIRQHIAAGGLVHQLDHLGDVYRRCDGIIHHGAVRRAIVCRIAIDRIATG